MAKEKTLELTLKVDDQGSTSLKTFQTNIQKSTDGIQRMGKSLSLIKVEALVNLAQKAYQAGQRIYDLARSTASFGSDIQRTAMQLGVSTDELQKWNYIAKMCDVESTSLAMGVRYLVKQIGDSSRGVGEALPYFQALGIDVNKLSKEGKSAYDIIGILADKFSKWEDGTQKMTYALNLFGSRAGQAFIPVLNLGREGVEKLSAEFDKFGLRVDQSTIKTLAEAENAFKRFEIAITNLKTRLAPIIEWLADKLDWITKKLADLSSAESIKKEYENFQSWVDYRIAAGGKVTEAEFLRLRRLKKLVEAETKPAIAPAKPAGEAPPEVLSPKTIADLEKVEVEFNKLIAQAQKLSDEGKMPSWEDSFFSYPARAYEDMTKLDIEFAKLLAETQKLSDAGEMPDWRESMEIIPKGFTEINGLLYRTSELLGMNEEKIKDLELEFNKLLADARRLSDAGEMPDWRESMETIPKGFVEIGGKIKTLDEAVKEHESKWLDMNKILSNSFEAGFFDLFKKGVNNLNDVFQGFLDNMVESTARAASKMLTNMLIWGNIKGETKEGGAGGIMGLFGTVIKAIGLQTGGSFWANRPTPIMVGEREPEFVNVTPRSKMTSGPQSMNLSFQINVGSMDKAKRFGSELRGEIETIVTRKLEEYSR
jgi:hypothetical protein